VKSLNILAGVAFAIAAAGATAQQYPTKPVTLVVPFAARPTPSRAPSVRRWRRRSAPT
jgi:hypothetical protein